jgi:hypothetical protein
VTLLKDGMQLAVFPDETLDQMAADSFKQPFGERAGKASEIAGQFIPN